MYFYDNVTHAFRKNTHWCHRPWYRLIIRLSRSLAITHFFVKERSVSFGEKNAG